MSGELAISTLDAPIADRAIEELASVLVDCVIGGASVSFMAPFSQEDALSFFRKVAASVAAGDTALLAARLDGCIVGTVQLGLDTPPNQPHRADVKKMLVHRSARGRGIGAALMAEVEQEAKRRGRWLLVLDSAGRERVPALQARRLDRERHYSQLCAVSGRPALRHRAVLEAFGGLICTVIPGRVKDANPESRDFGLHASHGPGMTAEGYCIPTLPASQPSMACLRVMPQ